ncbi:hypothetical protein L7F22_058275 [Adiantum nelumboides]|nr:hypothetical protein [Adiantum nelumboides]
MTTQEVVQEKQGELAKSPEKELATKEISAPRELLIKESMQEEEIELVKSPQKETTKEQEDVLVQKKQKLPIVYATRTKEMNMTQFQWEELDELCRSTIRLHLAELVYFLVLECESSYALWQKLCNTYAKDTASNKVFMMQKLFNHRMKESASVASHINDFDSLFAQIRAQRINIDDEMKGIFLLCSLPPSWDIFCTAVSNSAPNGTLVYIDVTSSFLSEEMRRKAMGSSHRGEAHYVQKNEKQRKGHPWNCESKKEGNRDASKGRSKSPSRRNVQCQYCDKFGHIKKDCYAWKRDKGKGKGKDNDAKEEKPKSAVKIEELNIVQDDCDAQDINILSENNDVFYDAQETLSLQSFMPAELLVSGEVSHTWILDLGALLHVTPHRHWFTTYEETIGIVTLGDSYSCDIVSIELWSFRPKYGFAVFNPDFLA